MKYNLRGKRTVVMSRVAITSMFIGALLSAPFLIFQTNAGAAACVAPSTDYGQVTTSVNVPSAATYRVWTRMQVPDSTNNTYLLELDGNKCYTVGGAGVTANTWTWVSFQNGSQTSRVDVSLTAGSHSMKLLGNKPGVKVDRVVLVSDLNCVPSGLGDNCNVPDDTTAPKTTMTAPIDASTVSGTSVGLTATVTDTTGVSRAEFYADGVHISSDTSSPYSTTWDSTQETNGTHTLSVRGYDTAGNMSSSSVSVTVKNGDTQAPAVPLSVIASALSATKVQLKWAASADNVGVAGYNVFRDGVPVAKIEGGATQYDNTGLVPVTTYSYQVEAYDTAGNRSALSAKALVVTPAAPDVQAPSAPQGLTATTVSPTQINLAWTRSTDNVAVAGYDIYRATSGQSPQKIATVSTTSYGDTDLGASTTYSYYVVATDAAGNSSARSTTVSAATEAQPSLDHRISGKVMQSNDKVIPSATVTATINGARYITQTNKNGWYAVRDLDTGRYSLTAYKKGYKSSATTVVVEDVSITTQNITLQRW